MRSVVRSWARSASKLISQSFKYYDQNNFLPKETYNFMPKETYDSYVIQRRSKRAGPPAGVHGRVEGQGRLLAVRTVPLSGES